MNIPFFTDYLMVSSAATIVWIAIFLALLIGIYALQKKGTSFAKLVMAGTVLGALLGLAMQIAAGFPEKPMDVVFIKEATKWYSLVGGGFIDLIRMLVVPLVFVSIVTVVFRMSEDADIKKLVSLTVVVSLGMVSIAAIVGLTLGSVFGLGLDAGTVEGASKMREVKPMVDTFRALIPNNPVKAMADTSVISVVIFAFIFAAIARTIRQQTEEKLEITKRFFEELHKIVFWMADFIIGLMPYGIVALLASTLAQRGFPAIIDMGLFIVLLYAGLAIMFIAQSILLTANGISPVPYFKKATAPLALAFTSRSSMGVLPLTIETLVKRLGVSEQTANTVGSWSTTAGMQGCAGVFPALVVVYIANIAGIDMDITFYIMSVIVIAIGSIGIAGVPGTATMAASVSLSGTGLGAYFVAISPILAIDPIIDMGRTMLNVSGAMTNAIVVDKLLGTFQQDEYNA